jgi:hypothetical protein
LVETTDAFFLETDLSWAVNDFMLIIFLGGFVSNSVEYFLLLVQRYGAFWVVCKTKY